MDKENRIGTSFWKVCLCWWPKIIKINPYLSKLRLPKLALFLKTRYLNLVDRIWYL